MTLLKLYWSFLLIGFSSFGGLSMIPQISSEVVSNGWMTVSQVTDIVAIAEMTPGPLGLNCATFAGMQAAGIPGAIAATVGAVFPSVCIVMFIAAVLHNFAELAVVQHAFAGIRVVVSVLIINAVVGLRKKSIVDKICVVIAIAAFLISVFADISPAIIVVAAAILGIAISCGREAKKE